MGKNIVEAVRMISIVLSIFIIIYFPNLAIATFAIFVLRGTVIGLRYRFSFVKRPEDYSSPEGAAKAVEALGKPLIDSKFKDVRSEAEPLIKAITQYHDLVIEDLIEAHLRPHAGWFKKQFDAYVKELRSVSYETLVTTDEHLEHYDDFSNLVAESRLYSASQTNYEASVRVFSALGLTGYARMDWRLNSSGEPVFLEANPNPALSQDDDFALAAKSAGVSYGELIARIIESAILSEKMKSRASGT